MIPFLDIVGSVLQLALPIGLGVIVAAVGSVRDVPITSRGLNAFVLYIAFPSLIISSLASNDSVLPSNWGFWASVPMTQAVIVAWAALLTRLRPAAGSAGAVALTGLFPNAGYLGLPLCIVLFGQSAAGPASLLVALHVAAGVSLGPWLLGRWTDAPSHGSRAGDLIRQPLVWSPLLGWMARSLPGGVREPLASTLHPIGAAAAPVALFLLGLYMWHHRRDVRVGDPGLWFIVATRLVLAPALSFGVAAWLVHLGALGADEAVWIVLFGALPVAVTAMVLSAHAGVAVVRVAGAIVVSTLLALATLPLTIRAALVYFMP